MLIRRMQHVLPLIVFQVILFLLLCMACGEKQADSRMESIVGKDYYDVLGIKSYINAGLPYSTLSGAQMWPEVIDAMNYGMTHRAKYKELHDAVGHRIASLIGCEAAMVPAGATSGIILGTAACMTGANPDLIKRIPDTRGMRNEVIIQKAHRYSYDRAVRCTGATLVEVETAQDLKRAVNDKTAMILFYYGQEDAGKISAKQCVALGKKLNIPVFMDGATTIPPASNLKKIMDLGCDLACFSGGKGLQGPFSAGLLLGRKDLIEAARLNSSPNDGTLGRGMKVSKEELLGMLVAVEVMLKRDYDADVRLGKQWMNRVGDQLKDVSGVRTTVHVPKHQDQVPHLRVEWDESVISMKPKDLIMKLRKGNPSIEVVSFGQTGGYFEISAWMIQEHELDIVARRIREELIQAMQGS